MNARLRVALGWLLTAVTLIAAWWFGNNYFRIGPDHLEPIILPVGIVLLLFLAAVAVTLLAKGQKQR